MKNSKEGQYDLGMVGLGTMGRNMMYNMADHGFAVAGFDTNKEQLKRLEDEGKGKSVDAFDDLSSFLASLKKPRKIMMLVPAGKIVDIVINELTPLIEKGDIIIDAGNSHFTDTDRRIKALESQGFHFMGMGVSGGEKGARNGPSMMPGGDMDAYKSVQPILEAIAAKVDGENCVTYIGPGASGHFVKMVHNGIEYAIMQLISETYQIMKKGFGMQDKSIYEVYKEWEDSDLSSYLMEITRDIFAYKEKGSDHLLLDDIKDEAKANGTGKWTSQIAMDLQLPTPTIDIAVSMRDLSKYKSLRINLNKIYKHKNELNKEDVKVLLPHLKQAYYFASIIAYAQGMHLLSKASAEYDYKLNMIDIAKIWRGGCIIRSEFLNIIYKAFDKKPDLEHLLLDEKVQEIIKGNIQGTRIVLSKTIAYSIGSPGLGNALSYFELLTDEHNPTNLIQAQRDFFGAHTYELIGKEGVFHTEWEA